MFSLKVHAAEAVITLPLSEQHLRNIKITHGSAGNVIVATPQEVFNLPGNLLWALANDAKVTRSALTTFADSTDLEDLEALVQLLNDGLSAHPTPFRREGAAKAVLQKLKTFIKASKLDAKKEDA